MLELNVAREKSSWMLFRLFSPETLNSGRHLRGTGSWVRKAGGCLLCTGRAVLLWNVLDMETSPSSDMLLKIRLHLFKTNNNNKHCWVQSIYLTRRALYMKEQTQTGWRKWAYKLLVLTQTQRNSTGEKSTNPRIPCWPPNRGLLLEKWPKWRKSPLHFEGSFAASSCST